FQWPGGVTVASPSAQNRAISVWSAVRVVLRTAPSSLTSRKSAAYSGLSSGGCAGGRNWSGRVRANGATARHWGKSASRKVGGVGRGRLRGGTGGRGGPEPERDVHRLGRLDGVVDGDVDHRQVAGGDRRRRPLGTDAVEGRAVPQQDRVGRREERGRQEQAEDR